MVPQPMATLPGFSLARRLAAGETVFTGWCALPAPIVAETMAREGFNTVTVDQQHGLWDTAEMAAGIAAIRSGGAAPVVRIPLGSFAQASRALDLGAEGIIAPMINTVADAKAFVGAAKFPPLGERSWGPTRAMTLAGICRLRLYLREANANIVTLAMIETPHRDEQSRRHRGGARHRRAVRRAIRSFDRADRRRRARSAFGDGRGRARQDRRRLRQGRTRSPASTAPTPSARWPAPSAASVSRRRQRSRLSLRDGTAAQIKTLKA